MLAYHDFEQYITPHRTPTMQSNSRILFSDIKFCTKGDWKPVKPLGNGTFGDVHLFQKSNSTSNDMGVVSAVKRVKRVFNNSILMKRAIRELRIMQHLRGHPNIVVLGEVDLVEASNSSLEQQYSGLYLYIEYMEMDLASMLRNPAEVLTKWHVAHFGYQLISAVHYMHSAGIIHRDLKPSNMLVNRSGILKICDFGLARGFLRDPDDTIDHDDRDNYTSYVTTRWYRAPEIILCVGKYHYGLDMWAVGCILAEMVLRRPLFRGSCSIDQIQRIIYTLGVPPYLYEEVMECFNVENQPVRSLHQIFGSYNQSYFLELISQLLLFMPEERLSARQALEHEYFDEVRQCNLTDNAYVVSCPSLVNTDLEYARDDALKFALRDEVFLSCVANL